MSEIRLSDQLEQMAIEDVEDGAKAAIEAMKKSLNSSYEHMIRVGHFLNAMKAKLPHGSWGQWLKDNFDDSRQWAARLMACATDRANVKSTLHLANVTTIEQHYALLMNTPEKQAKRAEREARKAEAPAKPLAPATPAPPAAQATIRHEFPPTSQPQPERPAWLADPDELERPEVDDLPQLPRTNTHHTAANRRGPDARETDRVGLVSPEDPRDLQDGRLYIWNESANRLFRATADEIWEAAMEVVPEKLAGYSGAPTPDLRATKKVVDHDRDTKRFVRPTVAEVAAYAAEIGAAIDPEQFIDFYTSKDWMIGKNKMKCWRAAVRTWKRQQAGKAEAAENGKVRSANWEDDGTGWEDLRDG